MPFAGGKGNPKERQFVSGNGVAIYNDPLVPNEIYHSTWKPMTGRVLRTELLESRCLLAGDAFLVSEFMAKNDSAVENALGDFSDWIEIFNPTDQQQDLLGWSLTDDPDLIQKWTFTESLPVAPLGYTVIWASGQDGWLAGEPHTNFKLDADGEYLALANPAGIVVSQFGDANTEYPSQSADVSFGTNSDGQPRYYLAPTPGAPNDDDVAGLVADTKFSVDRGFYDAAFTLEVTSSTPNAVLVYTLDGSAPTTENGIQVSGDETGAAVSVEIDGTTTVRAMAFRDGWTSTNVDTQSYLFLDQVVRQTGDDLPSNWGHAGADYEMDPQIVNDPAYKDIIQDSLLAIPTVSLVTDMDNWFGAGGQGIYPQGQGSPRPVSVELLFPDTEDELQVDGAVEIQGGSSTDRWKSDKLSMQLKFQSEYGDTKLRYPLFGDVAADKFDTLIIDARLNMAWHYGGGSSPLEQRGQAQFTRDQFVANLQRELGGHAPHGQWIHLYLNGIYWGMHNLHERPDEHFAEAYLGGNEEDYDIIKHNSSVVNGSFQEYERFLELVHQDVGEASIYGEVLQRLDVDEFINYMLTNYFVGNTDWAHHNWYASRNAVTGDGEWRYHSWDAELVLKNLHDNNTGAGNELGPTRVHNQLMQNAEYRLQFMDAVQSLFFNDGKLTPQRTIALYQQSVDNVYDAIVAESARWGDNRRSEPYTRDVEWLAERDRLVEEYFPQRTDVVLQQLRAAGFFHAYDAPSFQQHGGVLSPGEVVTVQSDGDVFYTTDGTDPRTSDTALPYVDGISLESSALVQVRALRNGNEWSAMMVATFDVPELGDFSGDGILAASDLDLLVDAVRQGRDAGVVDLAFDLTDDELVDSLDVDFWVEELAQTRHGDANLDGRIDFTDFLVLSTHYGQKESSWGRGDFDIDEGISFTDFLILSTNFGWRREV